MTVQTSVSVNPAVGLAGLEYDSAYNDVVTKIAAEDMPFGVYAVFTAEETCELPDTAAEITGENGGVVLRDPSKATTEGYKQGDAVRVLVRGRVWVETEDAVTQSDGVFARFSAGATLTQKGAVRSDNGDEGGGALAAAVPDVTVFKGNSAAGLAVLNVNVPQGAV